MNQTLRTRGVLMSLIRVLIYVAYIRYRGDYNAHYYKKLVRTICGISIYKLPKEQLTEVVSIVNMIHAHDEEEVVLRRIIEAIRTILYFNRNGWEPAIQGIRQVNMDIQLLMLRKITCEQPRDHRLTDPSISFSGSGTSNSRHKIQGIMSIVPMRNETWILDSGSPIHGSNSKTIMLNGKVSELKNTSLNLITAAGKTNQSMTMSGRCQITFPGIKRKQGNIQIHRSCLRIDYLIYSPIIDGNILSEYRLTTMVPFVSIITSDQDKWLFSDQDNLFGRAVVRQNRYVMSDITGWQLDGNLFPNINFREAFMRKREELIQSRRLIKALEVNEATKLCQENKRLTSSSVLLTRPIRSYYQNTWILDGGSPYHMSGKIGNFVEGTIEKLRLPITISTASKADDSIIVTMKGTIELRLWTGHENGKDLSHIVRIRNVLYSKQISANILSELMLLSRALLGMISEGFNRILYRRDRRDKI